MSLYVIDGRYIQDRFPGVGRYAFNLIGALARIAPIDRFRVICDRTSRNSRHDLSYLARSPNVELAHCGLPVLSINEQLLGCHRGLFEGAALFHSLSYTKPLLVSVPSIVTLYDITPLIVPEELPNPATRALCRIFYRLAIRSARRIITPSLATSADLQRFFRVPAEKISVVPMAADERFSPLTSVEVDATRTRLGLPEEYLLYFGSNKPKKNLSRLLCAWARVRSDAILVIAGQWDHRYAEPKRVVAELSLEARVRFLPDVPESEVPNLMAGAKAFVFPSLHEGFGLPPLEAMACGVPVLCSNSASLPEVVGEAALLFDAHSVEMMADTLARVLEDTRLREDLCQRSLARARLFTWESAARRTLAVYKEALGEFPPI